jgi:hypothetical protein
VLFVLLAAESQPMPRAPRPRTVESAITFFMCFTNSCFLLKE